LPKGTWSFRCILLTLLHVPFFQLEREREKEEARRLKESTRLKASIERATARRLARECVELIDDERLELLEAATAAQGLPSIYLLDGETLRNLDRYKGMSGVLGGSTIWHPVFDSISGFAA
jgi:hypothetical protein